MAKATESKPSTTSTKAKAKARTIDEQIAELQAKKQARLEKGRSKAELDYAETVGKFNRAVSQATKFAGQLRQLAAAYGFTLPDGVEPANAAEVEAAQVARAEAESAGAVGVDVDNHADSDD